MNQKVGFGKRLELLCSGENVKGEAARQGHRELIQLREVREQGGRGEGVGKQEQEGVAGVVLSSSDQESAQKAHIARQAKS